MGIESGKREREERGWKKEDRRERGGKMEERVR